MESMAEINVWNAQSNHLESVNKYVLSFGSENSVA